MTSQLLRFIFLYRWPWRALMIFLSFLGALTGILGPYFQKHFIDGLLSVSSTSFFGFEENLTPLSFIFLAFLCLILSQFFGFAANAIGMKEAIVLQKRLGEKIYRKTLRLRPDSLHGKTVGEIVALYATDVMGATIFIEQSLPTGAATLFPLLLAPLALYWLFQLPLTELLTVMVVVIAINSFLAMRQAVYFTRFKQLAAERIGLVNEWILNIKALKILGWIDAYEKKIHQMRVTETNNRIAMVTNGQTMNSVSSTVTFAINIVAVSILVRQRQGSVTPGELLSLLWILGIFLTRPFRQLPWFFTFGFDGWTSLKRISAFLSLQNQGRDWPPQNEFETSKMETSGPSIEVLNLNLRINDEELLKSISFSIKPQEFIAIVGEVGSGKSLLLLSPIGETGAHFDEYRINGESVLPCTQKQLCRHFAYVPQEGFVMSANLRDNIAFDYQVTNKLDARVTQCLQLAQFRVDGENLPERLETEIGERGVNLSGGQKQRVSLARADFYDCPVILMDDSLSALDVNTEEEILRSLLKGRWAQKTRILATHRLSVLKEVDRIFFLEKGQLREQGSLAELLKTSEHFRQFVKTLSIERQNEVES